MHKVELINFETVQVAEPRPPLDEEGMHFASLRYPTRQLQLYMHGHVAQAPEQAHSDYGGGWSFWFKPASEDVANLIKLEDLLVQYPTKLDLEINRYERRETLNDNSHLRIKLKRDEDGWKFTTNTKLTEDSLTADLAKGTPVTLTLAPGFYFSDDVGRYGLYYTLKEVKFPEAVEAPMRATKKAAATKRPVASGLKNRILN